MNKKIIKNDLSENSFPDIENENENEIIEKLINNSLLDEREDIEEEYDEEEDLEEENYSEKDKITEEILDNKLSIFTNIDKKCENNILENNNKKKKTIHIYKDIIENLLIELFEYHYTQITKEQKINLRNKIVESKCHIELFCSKLSVNFSKNILCIMGQKINELNDYVINKINEKKNITLLEIFKIKNDLKLTGKDINKIFEKPFQRAKSFDISSVIVVLFITHILNGNIAYQMTEKEYEQFIEIESIEEKDLFEKYIEQCKLSLFITEENNEKEKNENKIENNENKNEECIQNNIIRNNVDNNNNNINKEKDLKKEKNMINNNINHNLENISKNNNDKINKNNNEEKPKNFSDIEDLVEYINGNDNKKKRKKKRKKKTKVKIVEEEKKENIEIEKDVVFENFKTNLIDFTENMKNFKKIKPKISEAFLEKLKLIY